MKTYIKISLFTAIGAGIGYLYYTFFGCKSGCPLQSNWMITSIYGAVSGLILSFPVKKKEKKEIL